MKPTDRFQLTDAERSSTLWLRLRAHYEGQLRRLRLQNDDRQDHEKTTFQRGRIAEVKSFLSLHDAIPMPGSREQSS